MRDVFDEIAVKSLQITGRVEDDLHVVQIVRTTVQKRLASLEETYLLFALPAST